MPFIDQSAIHASAEPKFDADRLLAAISAVESGNDDRAVGSHGEAGRFQFSEETWKEETDLPFNDAFDYAKARAVAKRHLFTLKWQLQERRIEPTVIRLATAWRGGIGAVILNKLVNQDLKSYSVRVENLYLSR